MWKQALIGCVTIATLCLVVGEGATAAVTGVATGISLTKLICKNQSVEPTQKVRIDDNVPAEWNCLSLQSAPGDTVQVKMVGTVDTVMEVGGSVTGFSPTLLVCKNKSTVPAAKLRIENPPSPWSCDDPEFPMATGDLVQMKVRGVTPPSDDGGGTGGITPAPSPGDTASGPIAVAAAQILSSLGIPLPGSFALPLDPLNPCSRGGTTETDATTGITTFTGCKGLVDTDGDEVGDAVQIQTGTMSFTSTETGSLFDNDVTTTLERLSDGQLIKQEIFKFTSESVSQQTEECGVTPTKTTWNGTIESIADTDGDGTIDKDTMTTLDFVMETTTSIGSGSICEGGDPGTSITVVTVSYGRWTITDNITGQTFTWDVDPSDPQESTVVTESASTVDGQTVLRTTDGSGMMDIFLPCFDGEVSFDVAETIVTETSLESGFVARPIEGKIAVSGATSGTITFSTAGIHATGDGTSGFITMDLFTDPFLACKP